MGAGFLLTGKRRESLLPQLEGCDKVGDSSIPSGTQVLPQSSVPGSSPSPAHGTMLSPLKKTSANFAGAAMTQEPPVALGLAAVYWSNSCTKSIGSYRYSWWARLCSVQDSGRGGEIWGSKLSHLSALLILELAKCQFAPLHNLEGPKD